MRHTRIFVGLILLAVLSGCARYHQAPLNPAATRTTLGPPDMDAVRIQASEINHPLLPPLTLDDRDGLSPDEAAVMAVLVNPTLRAARDRRQVAAAQLFQAGLLPDPQFSPSMDFPTGGTTVDTVNAFGLVFDWDASTLLTRNAERDAARHQAAAVDLDIAWQEWQVAQSARLHTYRLIFLERMEALARKEAEGLKTNYESIKSAYSAGNMTVIDLDAAEASWRQAQATILTIEQTREQERLALNRTLGIPPDDVIRLQSGIEPPQADHLPTLEGIMTHLEDRRLDLLALRKGYASQEARVRAAIRAQFPKISLGFAELRDTGNVGTTGFSLSISLPIFDRNRGAIAVERATRQQLFDEYTARVFDTRADVARLLADLASLRRQIEAADTSIATQERLVRISYRGLLEGNVDVLSYYNEKNKLLSMQIDELSLKQALADNWVGLETAAAIPSITLPAGKEASH